MAQEYASQKPAGFKNYIENIAIVGVSHFHLKSDDVIINLLLTPLTRQLVHLGNGL